MAQVNWTNVTSFADLPAQANVTTGGGFWAGMLYMLWIILMLLMIGYGFEIAILTASFIALTLALMLVYANLVSWSVVLSFVGVILLEFLYIIWTSAKVKQ